MTAPLVRGWEACDFNMSLHFHVAWHQQWSVALQFQRLWHLRKKGWGNHSNQLRSSVGNRAKEVSWCYLLQFWIVSNGGLQVELGKQTKRSGGIMRNIVLYRCGYGTLDKWTFVWRAMQPIRTTRTEAFQYKDRCVFVIILLYYTAIYTVPLLLPGTPTNLTVLIWTCLDKWLYFSHKQRIFTFHL